MSEREESPVVGKEDIERGCSMLRQVLNQTFRIPIDVFKKKKKFTPPKKLDTEERANKKHRNKN